MRAAARRYRYRAAVGSRACRRASSGARHDRRPLPPPPPTGSSRSTSTPTRCSAAEEGRLALRGRNTSGKSKALELLIPFVLDGDITPRKLDPFASPTRAKTMRWNLIECTDAYARDAKRIGYVWAEFIAAIPTVASASSPAA